MAKRREQEEKTEREDEGKMAAGGYAHGGHPRRPRRARGGGTKVNEYNAQGAPETHEATDEEESFRRGGHAKRRAGGRAEGEMAEHRADKMPRGKRHHEKRAAGGRANSPLSSGSRMDAPADDQAGRGHEGVKVPSEPF